MFLSSLRRQRVQPLLQHLHSSSSRRNSTNANTRTNLDDDHDPALPSTPPYSIHALLSSYPSPTLSDTTLDKLHRLAALHPPAVGSPERAKLKEELEEMVRLVEAVRSVDARALGLEDDKDGYGVGDTSEGSKSDDCGGRTIPDGRIWPEGVGMPLSTNTRAVEFDDPEVESGVQLLKHAQKTRDGFYVVEAERRKK